MAKERTIGLGLPLTMALASALFLGGALRPFASGEERRVMPDDVRVESLLSPSGNGASSEVSSAEARVAADPDDAGAHALLGFAFLERARAEADPAAYDGAEEAFRSALEIDEEDLAATIGSAVLAGARHDFEGAVVLARRAARLDPYSSLPPGVEGDALLELGRQKAAESAIQRAVDLRPDLASYARAAFARQARGDAEGALRLMRLAARSTTDGRDAAWALSQVGEIHLSVRRLGAAERCFERAHFLAPGFYLPDVGRAHVAFARGDLDRAIRIQRSVVDRFPQPSFVAELGDLLWSANRKVAASTEYRESARLLEGYLDHGVLIDVEMPVFFADRRRDPRRALHMARALYRSRKGQAAADALAWALWANRRYDSAERHIREALREGPPSPDVLFHAGMIAHARGDLGSATRRLGAALDLNPYWGFREPATARRILGSVS